MGFGARNSRLFQLVAWSQAKGLSASQVVVESLIEIEFSLAQRQEICAHAGCHQLGACDWGDDGDSDDDA